jgi:hypothetical protein
MSSKRSAALPGAHPPHRSDGPARPSRLQRSAVSGERSAAYVRETKAEIITPEHCGADGEQTALPERRRAEHMYTRSTLGFAITIRAFR